MTETKEIYRTGQASLDFILARISDRLDIMEGLRPDLDAGLYSLASDKDLTTTGNSSANWDTAYTTALAVDEGTQVLKFVDSNGTTIHQLGDT